MPLLVHFSEVTRAASNLVESTSFAKLRFLIGVYWFEPCALPCPEPVRT